MEIPGRVKKLVKTASQRPCIPFNPALGSCLHSLRNRYVVRCEDRKDTLKFCAEGTTSGTSPSTYPAAHTTSDVPHGPQARYTIYSEAWGAFYDQIKVRPPALYSTALTQNS